MLKPASFYSFWSSTAAFLVTRSHTLSIRNTKIFVVSQTFLEASAPFTHDILTSENNLFFAFPTTATFHLSHTERNSNYKGCDWNFFKCYWSIVDLQCCVNFFCTAKWLSFIYIYIYIYIYTRTHINVYIYSFSYSFPYGLSQDIEYSSLCYTVRTLLSIYPIYNSLHLLIPNSQSYPPQPPNPCFGKRKSALYLCKSVSVKFICVIF